MNIIKLKDVVIHIDEGPRADNEPCKSVFIKVRLGDRLPAFFKFFPDGLGETTLEQFIKLMESAR